MTELEFPLASEIKKSHKTRLPVTFYHSAVRVICSRHIVEVLIVQPLSLSTYRVVNVEPFRGAGLHELAVDEQLGGGLKDNIGTRLNPFLPGYITVH